jgi:3-methyladenine DNA glycosylase/8-oxoguanine DNA glycosylase
VPQRTFRPVAPTDVLHSIGTLSAGRSDPTITVADGAAWMATRTSEGPATIRFTGSDPIAAQAWGPGADTALESAPDICGATDDPSGFDPDHDLVSRLLRRHPGLRTTRTAAVVEGLLRIIPSQRVTSSEAHQSYRTMTLAMGEPAPGPRPLTLPPDPAAIAKLGYPSFHPWGIERTRATTMIRVARSRGRLEAAADMALPDAYARITAVPGLGAWSAGKIGATALGDADAVPVGDFHLPNAIAWALAREPRADDSRMLELLDEFRPNRGRVIQLIKAAHITAPRYGPKTPTRSIERL